MTQEEFRTKQNGCPHLVLLDDPLGVKGYGCSHPVVVFERVGGLCRIWRCELVQARMAETKEAEK